MAVTYSPTFAVPSALSGLTSLFGMGRGGTPTFSPPRLYNIYIIQYIIINKMIKQESK